jgi:hypothetical protein
MNYLFDLEIQLESVINPFTAIGLIDTGACKRKEKQGRSSLIKIPAKKQNKDNKNK